MTHLILLYFLSLLFNLLYYINILHKKDKKKKLNWVQIESQPIKPERGKTEIRVSSIPLKPHQLLC